MPRTLVNLDNALWTCLLLFMLRQRAWRRMQDDPTIVVQNYLGMTYGMLQGRN